jgi:hypothetical protein
VAREHLIALAQRTPLLPGIAERAFLDIDSLLRPVYGHQKQGASFGHAKIAGRALLRKGLSPLVTTLSTTRAAPVIAEAWLRGGKTGSGRGAARQVKQAVTTARAIDPDATIMARGDSAFGTKKVIAACLDEQIEFSLALSRNRRVTKAIDSLDETAWTPVHYPGAVEDPDTGALISDAEVAETGYTLSIRGHGRVTARLVVRRVKDARYPDALFPVWRYHPFFTNSDLPTAEGRLPEAWIAPPKTRELRELVCYRATPCPHQLGEGITGSRTNPALPQRICAITAWRRPTTTPSAAAPPASDDSMHQAGPASRFVLATLRALRLDPRSLPRAAYTEAESQQNHWSTTC